MTLLFKYFFVVVTFPILFHAIDADIAAKKDLKILVVGNSILQNEPAPELGWNGDWGMAANTENTDFLHIYRNLLKRTKRYNSVDIKIKNIAAWENDFNYDLSQYNDVHTDDYDLLIVRLGENVTNIPNYYSALNNMINYFKAKKTKVIITGIIWENDAKEDVQKQIALDKGYNYISFEDFRGNADNYAWGLYENSQVAAHPSNTGMLLIAKLLFETTIEME